MNKTDTFEQFLATQSVQVHVLGFSLNLMLAGILAFLLGRIYIRYGHSISNRRTFSHNLVLLAMTTMVVITIVKSSLALSLGLVGALSIVRFRAAIKEPEELSYLFLAITIGLGLGADQRVITIVAMVFISAMLIVRNLKKDVQVSGNHLYLTFSSERTNSASLKTITEALNESCSNVDIRRFDETATHIEATFRTELANADSLDELKSKLRELDKDIRISFIDQQGVTE